MTKFASEQIRELGAAKRSLPNKFSSGNLAPYMDCTDYEVLLKNIS